MKILFAGGGTGGHLFSGVAVAEALVGRDGSRTAPTSDEILFVGTSYGLENELIPKLGYRLELIPVKQLKGKGILHRLKTLAQIPYAFWKSFLLLRKEKPDLVIGIGGYASGPVTLMARMMSIKTAIIEQNSMPGFTNRVLGKFVHRIFIAFENARKFFPKNRTYLTGNPVRKEFLSSPSPWTGEGRGEGEKKRFTILILGGSQGARSINQAMIEVAKYLSTEKIRIIHQTGKVDLESVRQAYQSAGIQAEVMDFIHNIQNYYAQAALVIARSGAGTITELEIMGKPSILIPYPYAADDHQKTNALELVNAGAARVILNHELSGERLFQEMMVFVENPEELIWMGEQAKKLAKPEAAFEILKSCEKMFLRS
jgi:UDP-N-acetylglucosamine--N-acetylmuramyl-(pentapeptide) pyrophosphoryl-undecaprenol N-acetylglucosamine transferase